mmetsp:Transcript_11878/g.35400  ORF Transcript_11878/g.35400 Transcript_11878/m.35400 type:complete len:289 (+) Transcript_11878:52-918(+)
MRLSPLVIAVAASASAMVPERIGVVGVGTISSACVRGLCGAEGVTSTFVLSPRGAAKGAALAEAFPGRCHIARDNQAVVDGSDCVILAVLPGQARAVLEPLRFGAAQRVISLMAGVALDDVRRWTGSENVALACPLPAVAARRGTTIVAPADGAAVAIFDALGKAVPVPTEAQFKRLQTMTCLMGDLYSRQLAAQEWLVGHGVDAAAAAAYVGGVFATMTSDAEDAGPHTLAELVAEQTPGGMNEMVIAEQRADGAYASLAHSMDSVYSRLAGAHDPGLAPAKRRKTP